MKSIATKLIGCEETDNSSDDPFIYDTDRLQAIASERVVRRGLDYFKEDRVMDLHWKDSSLCAQVEGSRPDEPYWVELTHDRNRMLHIQCDCPFDSETVYKHAVAVLYAYSAQVSHRQEIGSAIDTAIGERTKRGRSEVKVKHLSGRPWFGTWRAASLVSTTHRNQSYTVHSRSLHGRANYCTCPDLATNQLGTCKHLEAVLHFTRFVNDGTIERLETCHHRFPLSILHRMW